MEQLAGTIIAGGGAGALIALAVSFVLKARAHESSAFKSTHELDQQALRRLDRQVAELSTKVAELETAVANQRRRAHDWRSFAAGLLMERQVIRRIAQQHDCEEVIQIMDELDDVRQTHNLTAEIQEALEGNP